MYWNSSLWIQSKRLCSYFQPMVWSNNMAFRLELFLSSSLLIFYSLSFEHSSPKEIITHQMLHTYCTKWAHILSVWHDSKMLHYSEAWMLWISHIRSIIKKCHVCSTCRTPLYMPYYLIREYVAMQCENPFDLMCQHWEADTEELNRRFIWWKAFQQSRLSW